MHVQRLDPVADPRWRDFAAAARQPCVFHHPAWLGLVARRYRYRCTALCVTGADGELLAGLPLARISSVLTGRRLVAVPFSDVCPPAYAAHAGRQAATQLHAAIIEEHRRTSLPIELRWGMSGVTGAHAAPRFLSHSLQLGTDAEAVLAGASRSQVRRSLTKAQRAGVQVVRATDRAALREFYALHEDTRRRQGVPIQPKAFILGFEGLFAQGLGHVLLARHEGRTVAAAVFLTYGRTLTYKYGASDAAHLDVRPNHAIFAEAIRQGCASGLGELDFGRTDPDNEGLARFKRSWGADERPLAYTYLARSVPQAHHGLAERLIAKTIRVGPPQTGRMIGTALYRHVG